MYSASKLFFLVIHFCETVVDVYSVHKTVKKNRWKKMKKKEKERKKSCEVFNELMATLYKHGTCTSV